MSYEKNAFLGLLASLGKAGLHLKYPNDFELYLCSFELTDWDDRVVDMFIFPITPSSIDIQTSTSDNIQRTFGGISIMAIDEYMMKNISISGNFGRRLKFMLGNKSLVDANAIHLSEQAEEIYKRRKKTFNQYLKTGYACTKALEDIIELSRQRDKSGRPFKLYFHNLPFNQSYFVRIQDYSFKQSMDQNMIWNYNISMRSLARAEDVYSGDLKASIKALIFADLLNKTADATAKVLAKSTTKFLSKNIQKRQFKNQGVKK